MMRRKRLLRANADATAAVGPSALVHGRNVKPKREKVIKAVIFVRHRHSARATSYDFAIDWKVASPHAPPLLASAREWHLAHAQLTILEPDDLRRDLEEDLGIHEEELPPPGQGAREDRPTGNAREGGTLSNGASGAAVFVPPRNPRTTAWGCLQVSDMLPWARLQDLRKEVDALLSSTTLQHDVRSRLLRGKRALSRLHKDAQGLPSDAQGMRWKPTSYGRRMLLGRLTAAGSSMQPMPNLLRQWLYRGLLHDLDFENCHPCFMLGLVKKHRPQTWERDAPRLAHYVAHRHAFLDEVACHYELPGAGHKAGRDLAKLGILVAMNGGELTYWRKKAKSPVSPLKPELPSLLQLQREARWVRDTIVFVESAFAACLPALLEKIRAQRSTCGRTEEELRRSAFAYALGHLESMAVDAARAVLERHGFRTTDLLYDGWLATHSPDGVVLAQAMREAEAAAETAIGMGGLNVLTLKEGDMYGLPAFSLADKCERTSTRAGQRLGPHDDGHLQQSDEEEE